MNTQNNHNKGFLLGFIAVTAFALTLPATRFLTPYFDPVFIGLGRACIAAVVAALILFTTRSPKPSNAQLRQLALVALGVVIGFPLFTAVGMQTVAASHGGVVLGVLPLATVLASRLVSDERPSTAFYCMSVIGMGIVVCFSLLSSSDGIGLGTGDIALFLAVICAGFGYALGAHLSKSMGGWQVICWALVIAFPLVIVPTILSAPSNLTALPTSAWLAFLYLSLVSQLFGFFIWYHALAIGGIARVSQTQLLQPFITLCAAALLLGESLDTQVLLFAFAVLLCVGFGKRMPIHQSS